MINLSNNSGVTPLSVAAERGYEQVIKLLLEKKAEVDLPNNSGLAASTPLM